jgi:hypothetical protein
MDAEKAAYYFMYFQDSIIPPSMCHYTATADKSNKGFG